VLGIGIVLLRRWLAHRMEPESTAVRPAPSMRACPMCGNSIAVDWAFCPFCARAVTGANDNDQPANCGMQLEDGGVMVQYNCPDGGPDLVAQLPEIVRRYDHQVIEVIV
jgi:hypothetical protein